MFQGKTYGFVREEKRDEPIEVYPFFIFGGAERDRTVGLQSAILALSQLSYCPISENRRAHRA